MPYKKIVGANINRERTERDMSIDELARMLDLSPAFIGLIERGQRGAKLDNLIKIADIFGITLNDLIYEHTNKDDKLLQEPNSDKEIEGKKAAITSLLYDLNENELDFIISTIRSLKVLKEEEID